MGNNTQPVVTRSRCRNACGERFSSTRHWSEQQELRGDDLTAFTRACPVAQRHAEREEWLDRLYAGVPPCDADTLPSEESCEPHVADWDRQLERREDRFHDFVDLHTDWLLSPWNAEDLTPETVDETIARLRGLLPHLPKHLAQWVEAKLLDFTTWDGLAFYAHRLDLHRKWKEELALPKPELTLRPPRRGRGRYSRR